MLVFQACSTVSAFISPVAIPHSMLKKKKTCSGVYCLPSQRLCKKTNPGSWMALLPKRVFTKLPQHLILFFIDTASTHLTVSFPSSKMKPRRKFRKCQASKGLWAIIYQLALASKLTSQCLPWGTPGLSLVLIVMAAKETFPQFANRLSTHQRQGSARAPDGKDCRALLQTLV